MRFLLTLSKYFEKGCNSNKGNWTNWANWREKIASSFGNNSVILRISYVYVTYILRIWYVIDSGKTAERQGELGRIRLIRPIGLIGLIRLIGLIGGNWANWENCSEYTNRGAVGLLYYAY